MGKRAASGQQKEAKAKSPTKPKVDDEDLVSAPIPETQEAWGLVLQAIDHLKKRGDWVETGSVPGVLPGLTPVPQTCAEIPDDSEPLGQHSF